MIDLAAALGVPVAPATPQSATPGPAASDFASVLAAVGLGHLAAAVETTPDGETAPDGGATFDGEAKPDGEVGLSELIEGHAALAGGTDESLAVPEPVIAVGEPTPEAATPSAAGTIENPVVAPLTPPTTGAAGPEGSQPALVAAPATNPHPAPSGLGETAPAGEQPAPIPVAAPAESHAAAAIVASEPTAPARAENAPEANLPQAVAAPAAPDPAPASTEAVRPTDATRTPAAVANPDPAPAPSVPTTTAAAPPASPPTPDPTAAAPLAAPATASGPGGETAPATPDLPAVATAPAPTPDGVADPVDAAPDITPAGPTAVPAGTDGDGVTALVHAVRAERAASVDAPPAPAPAPAAREGEPTPPPAQQIAEALREVRRLSDGTHRLSLQLRPAELGTVQLEVAMRDGRLHLHALADSEGTARALEAALPELRSELREAGVDTGSLEVRDQRPDPQSDRRRPAGRPSRPGDNPAPAGPADGATDPTRPSTSSLVDVRL